MDEVNTQANQPGAGQGNTGQENPGHEDTAQANPAQPDSAPPSQAGRLRHRGPGRLGGAIFGLWIVLIGVLFLLQNLGIFYIGQIWQFWPLILVGMGLSHMIGSYYPGGKIWGAFLAGIGVIFLLSNMRMLPPHIWNYIWPLGLVFWGVRMLMGGPRFNRWERRGRRFRSDKFQWDRFNRQSRSSAETAANGDPNTGGFHTTTSNVANRLNEYAILGGVKRRIDSQDFEGGDCTAVMGGIELDLSRAATKLDEVVIEANALMGGVDLRVPPDWEVVVQGMGIMGGYDDATRPPVNMGVSGVKRPRLIVTGQALWGGVKVKN